MWEVYAYWNVEMLESVFNGLAAIAAANAYETLMYIIAILGFMIVMGTAVARLRAEEPFVWIFYLTLFYGMLFVPKDTVAIIDRTNTAGAPRVVANVPLGAAALVSMTSKIGDWLTRTYETVFTLPSELKFSGNGMTFGAKIIQAASNATFTDIKLNADLMEYVRACVAPDLTSGYKDLEALMKSEDLWASMGGTNPARLIWLSSGVTDCLDAYGKLTPRLNNAVAGARDNVARLLNPRKARTDGQAAANALLASQIPAAANTIMQVTSANTLDFVRQSALINLWRYAPGSMAAATENTAGAQLALAEAQAQSSSFVAYLGMASIASEALPKFRNVFQVIIISLFPIVMLLVLLAGHKGGAILKHYTLALLWIETWPVMFAVASFVAQSSAMDFASMGLLGGLATPAPVGQGITLMNAGTLQDITLRTQHIAGAITLLIPVFSAGVLWGGAFAMTSIAGSLMAPASSAAQSAGSQAGVGNVNMGNVRYDTFAARTHEANSWRTRPSYDPGNAGGYSRVDPSLKEDKKATGTLSQDADTLSAGAPVIRATPTSLGSGLAATADAGAKAGLRSERGATAEQSFGAVINKTDGAGYSHSTAARFMREMAEAINRDWKTESGYGRTWNSGSGVSGGSESNAGVNVYQKEQARFGSKANIEAGVGQTGKETQTYDPNRAAQPGATPPAPPAPKGSGKDLVTLPFVGDLIKGAGQAAPPADLPPGLQAEPVKIAGKQGKFGANASVGIDAVGVAELAHTAATGASNRYGLSQQQAAEVLRRATNSVAAQSTDRGTRAAAEEFGARLERGITVQDAEAVSASLRDSAAETREQGRGAGMQARYDLDTWVQAFAAGKGVGAMALMNMRQTDPAAFRSLVNEAKGAWEASNEGQRHMSQEGSLPPPRPVDEVFAQGIQDRGQTLGRGKDEVKDRNAADRKAVAAQQPTTPRSRPNIKPVIDQVSKEQQAAFAQYQAGERGAHYQRGAAMLAAQAVRDEHGALAPLRIALGGETFAPKSPQDVIERLDRLAVADPTVRDQIEHLGRQPKPTQKQIENLAEFIELRAKK